MTDDQQTVIAAQLGDVKAAIERVEGRVDRHAERNDRNFEQVKAKQNVTNGRVTGMEKRQARIEGIGIALVALTPFAVFALQQLA